MIIPVDGFSSVVCSSAEPKPLTEVPPPSYEEALVRNSVRLSELEEQVAQAQQQGAVGVHLEIEMQQDSSEGLHEVISEPTAGGPDHQSNMDIATSGASSSGIINILGAEGGNAKTCQKSEECTRNVKLLDRKISNEEALAASKQEEVITDSDINDKATRDILSRKNLETVSSKVISDKAPSDTTDVSIGIDTDDEERQRLLCNPAEANHPGNTSYGGETEERNFANV